MSYRYCNHLAKYSPSTTLIRWLLYVAVVAYGLIYPAVGYAQAEDAAEYWNLVEESLALVSQEEVTDADLDQLAQRWEAIETVFINSNRLTVRPELIAKEIASSNTSADDLETLRVIFINLQESRETWPQLSASTGSGQYANSELDRLLNDDRYQYEEERENRFQAWRQRFTNRVNEWLASRDDPADQQSGNNLLGIEDPDPITGLLGIIAAVVLGYILYNLIQGVSLGLMREPIQLVHEDDEFDEPLTAKEAMQQAESTAESGDYRRSVRYLYLSTLLVLEEKGMLTFDRSLTNREYINTAKRYPKVAPLLKEVVDVFDRVWYGSAQIDQPTLKQYQERIQELQNAKEEDDA